MALRLSGTDCSLLALHADPPARECGADLSPFPERPAKRLMSGSALAPYIR